MCFAILQSSGIVWSEDIWVYLPRRAQRCQDLCFWSSKRSWSQVWSDSTLHWHYTVVRLRLLLLLRDLILKGTLSCEQSPILVIVVKEWILPALAWRAGKTAACIRSVLFYLSWICQCTWCRYAALDSLATIVAHKCVHEAAWQVCMLGETLPLVYQSLDEDYFPETRLLALNILCMLVQSIGHSCPDIRGQSLCF